ncbi:MAG: LamG-like jellyroll fold domain-containing protein [Spirochaetota bacterium]
MSVLVLLLSACSGLKLDKESNCLNDKAACYKEDKTRPRVQTFTTQPPLDGANSLTELQHIDVTFSEEIKEGELAQTYKFKPSAGHTFNVTSVQRLSTYTYRLHIGGSLQNTGLVEIDIATLKDYNNNLMDTIVPVEFTGNVNIPIISSVNHNGVSTTGGYASVSLKFYHNYTADVTNANSYQVRLTSGAVDCSGGALLTSGSNLAPGSANEISWNVPAASFASGMNRLVVCISNANNPNAANSASWPIIRDDVAPVLTYTPAGGSYKDPQAITLSCSNNADKIAYTSQSQQGSVPTDPAAPTFDPATGNIVTGNPYGTGITAENPANPTYTKFIWRCIDIAGNLSTALATPVQFYIDNTIPGVTVNLASGYRQYISTVNPTSTLAFTTDQVVKTYNIRRNGTNCDAGGDGTLLASGTTPATAGQTISVALDITTHFTTPNTTYPVRICVAGTGIQWGTAYLEITRDDTVPIITPSVVSGSYGALQSVQFTCDDTFGSVHRVAYSMTEADGLTVPAAPASPVFNTATGVITTGLEQSGPLSPADRRTTRYAFSCIDRAGNVSTVGNTQYTIDATLPIVNFVSLSRSAVSGNAGAYGDTTLTFTSSRAGLTYRIRRVANCDHSGTPAETLLPDATIAAANANESVLLPASAFPSNGVNYPVRICVYNLLGASSHQTASVNVMRDNSYPTFAGLTSLTSGGAGQFTLNWSLAADTGSNVAAYNIYRSDSASGPWTTVHHVAAHPAGSINVTVPDPLLPYYYAAGAVDNAGNETKVTASPLATKPEVRLVVSGLGAGKSFTFTDGTGATATISSNSSAPGTLFATSLALGQTYALNINAQPVDQVCGIRQRQFGTLSANLNVEITCVDGAMVAGRFQSVPAAPLASMLYRTSATVQASSFGGGSMGNVNSLAVVGGNIYYGSDLDCLAGAGVAYCLYAVPTGGSTVTSVLTGLSGVIRGITSDGTNLYFTMLAPENKLFKLTIGSTTPVEIASGFSNPFGVALDSFYAYVADKGANAIVRIDLRTGTKSDVVTGLAAGPTGITVVGSYLYITLDGAHAIYRALKAGGSASVVAGNAATAGHEDNAGTAARLSSPHDLLFDGYDHLYFTEYTGHYVRRLRLSTGRVTTLAGDGTNGLYQNGTGPTTRISSPVGIGSDGRRLYIGLHGADKRIVRLEESGLRGYWPLHVNTELRDFNGQNATVNDMSWVSGVTTYVTDRYGKETAVSFNGTNTQLQASSPLTAGSACNVSAAVWFKATNPATGSTQVVFHNGNSGTSGYGIILADNGTVGVLFGGTGGVGPGTYAVANEWTHAAIVCRGSNIWSLYINGHLAARGNGTPTQRPNANTISQIFVGKGAGGATEFFSGAISDLRLYTRALSDAEVSELAQDADENLVGKSYNRRATELLSHYEFDALSSGDGGALNHTVTNSSAGPVDGKEGDYPGAVGLDGTSGSFLEQSIATGLPIGTQPRTLCAFVKPNRQPAVGSRYPIVSFGSTTTLFKGTELVYYSPGLNDYRIALTKIGDSVDASVTLPVRTWSHVCATNDGATTRLYVHGREVPPVAGSAQVFETINGALRVGKRVYNADVYNFNGHIDDVRIYNKALSAFEIRQLAQIVPAGLVHHYDFAGDLDDASGFSHTLTNNDASPTDDRFGLNSSAYKFNGSSSSLGANAMRNASNFITMAAWISPVSANADTGIVSNWNGIGGGLGGSGGGLILDSSGRLAFLAKGNGSDSDCYTSWVPPREVYSHVAATVDSNSLKVLVYANGTEVGNCNVGAGKPEFRNNDDLKIAKYNNLFAGSIDDVRIYNRALTAVEVRALVQHPNKRIFVTDSQSNGNLGGITGADATCNGDTAKPTGANYKAMLVDGSNRRACSSSSCSSSGLSENIDWVLQPQVTYVQAAGELPVFTANSSAIYPFGTFTNAISGAAVYAWTGLTTGWQVGNSLGVDLDCGNWNGGTQGAIGQVNSVTSSSAYSTTDLCASVRRLYCVEQ